METNNYAEMLKNCKVSEHTANFIACKMSLNDLYVQMYDAICAVYGEKFADDVINRKYSDKSFELDSIIDEFIIDSISDKINSIEVTKI